MIPYGLRNLAIAAVALFLIGLYSGEIYDPDFWWHLKTGQFIVQQHRLPVPDPFSYTTATAKPAYPGEDQTRYFNLTHEWLAQVSGYLVYAIGGFAGIVLVRALLLTAACFVAAAIITRRTKSLWWGLAGPVASGSVLAMFATDRPTLISFLSVLVFIAAFEWRRGLWALPLLAIFWANGHGGFFLAWMVCGAYSVDALIRREKDWRKLLLVSAATFAASALNPNGLEIIPTLLRYQRASAMTAVNMEWAPAEWWGRPYGYNILLYACLPILAISWRKVRPADWILFLFFAYASLTALRNEPYMGLYAPILIASYFPWKRKLTPVLRLAGIGALMATVGFGAARGPFFQFRAGEWRYPAGAAAFLQDHHITAPIFNTFFIGGYLIWKGVPVFIDGRSLSENVFRDHQTVLESPPGSPARREVLERYGIGAIVMDSYSYYPGNAFALNRAMAYPDMADWKLVYEDPQSMVFLRNPPPDLPALPPQRIADHLESQCRNLIEHDPEYPGCARSLGFLVRVTNPARARRMFELYFAHAGSDAEARAAYEELPGK